MESVNVGCIIQARMSSSRLPGKIMKNLDKNKTVLDYVIDQLSWCKSVDKIIIATTKNKEDDIIVDFAKSHNLSYFRGSEIDVLDRYYQCAKYYSVQHIVRITSDCPLVDPNIVDDVVISLISDASDYSTNKLPIDSPTCPHGSEIEAFTFKSLQNIWKKSKKQFEKEHVTPYIYNHPNEFKISSISTDFLPFLRYTIDHDKDLELVRMIVSKIKSRPIVMKNIEILYNNEPKIFDLNSEYSRNEGYLKSIQGQKTDF